MITRQVFCESMLSYQPYLTDIQMSLESQLVAEDSLYPNLIYFMRINSSKPDK